MGQKRKIVIIPCFDEEANIKRVVEGIQKIAIVDEIVVVDDGSGDDTAEIARACGATVISLIVNLGYGAALQTGYKYAFDNHYDVAVQIDGDGQHDPKYIANLVQTMENEQCDVVIGSRFMEPETAYKTPFSRKVGICFFRSLIRLFIKQRITDPTSGYQALNKKVVEFFAKGSIYPPDYPDADIIILLNNLKDE